MEREIDFLTELIWCEITAISWVWCEQRTCKTVNRFTPTSKNALLYESKVQRERQSLIYLAVLVHPFIVNAFQALVFHGERALALNSDQCRASGIKIAKNISNSSWISRTVWVELAKYTRLRFLNNHRYLLEEVDLPDTWQKVAWSENVMLVDIRTARSKFINHDVVSVQATRNITLGEKILVDFQRNFEFKIDSYLLKSRPLVLRSFSKSLYCLFSLPHKSRNTPVLY